MKRIACAAVAALLTGIWSADAQIITGSTYSSTTEYASSAKNTRYQGELNFGYGLGGRASDDSNKEDAYFSRVFIETVHGMRINDYVFAGIGAGFQYAYDKKNLIGFDEDGVGFIPVFLDLKGYYPVTDDFAPYVAVDLGYGLPVMGSDGGYGTKLKGGFYASYGIGLNYKKLNFGLGWQHQSFKYDYDGQVGDSFGVNSFFVKIGLKF